VVGVRRSDAPARATVDDRFHLGSNTKAMTATLAALAVERGALGWDTDAAEVLPGTPRRGATLLQLLSHGAGLLPYEEDDEIATVALGNGNAAEQRRVFARAVLADEPVFSAGTAHTYSNAGYSVAAAMVETALDEPWEDLLLDSLLAPLEIDGGVGWPARADPAQPWGHFDRAGMFVPHDPEDAYQLSAPIRPAGDVHASLEGYARFLQLHLRGLNGDTALLSDDSFRRLHTAVGGGRRTERGDRFHGHAVGWGILDIDGVRSSVHSGSADTFYAVVALQPDRNLAAAVVANAAGPAVERALGPLLRELLATTGPSASG
jgi:CubicO group peptidase (beta-lactamase class C family)